MSDKASWRAYNEHLERLMLDLKLWIDVYETMEKLNENGGFYGYDKPEGGEGAFDYVVYAFNDMQLELAKDMQELVTLWEAATD